MAFMLSILVLDMQAQVDSLPKFLLTERNGYVIVGWNNPFRDISQLIIQRSTDSTSGFRSIISMPDPAASSNGFVDKKGGSAALYYRIFYVLPGGRYEFTPSKKPVQLVVENKTTINQKDSNNIVNVVKNGTIERLENVKKINLVDPIGKKEGKETADKSNPSLKLNTPEVITTFQPSAFIFSNEEGNLILLLPDAEKKHYHLHVFREDGTTQFKMKNIKERHLTVDRSNFYQSGWFSFELFDGDVLKEKNRFFIPPEGR